MKLYNTLTRAAENFAPLDGAQARIYSCGPTVYDHAHIGNLSAYVFADSLRRAVAFAGFDIKHVMNYTDVDDKTIRRSREQFPDADPLVALKLLTDKYIGIFRTDMERIGTDITAITFVRATERIAGMRQLIRDLHAAGFAYIADDGVYFSIEAYRKSGKTYGQLLELTAKNTSEARIQNDEYDKESVHDFALWKTQKDGEPAWEFKLDGHDLTGRPGWHIECSVMSRQELGQPFDIHTGGIDLIFPHHENEIAQSTALETDPHMAQFFAHNDHILVDGKKMSKSAHNFYTLEDVLAKGYDPLAFRVKILQSHYRNAVNFTWESLDAAQNLLNNLRAWADLKHQPLADQHNDVATTYAAALKNIQAAIDDDLNTSLALGELAALANQSETHGVDRDKIQAMLNIADRLFGLQLGNRPTINDTQKHIVADRQAARDAKDWATSDRLRDQLLEQGITVRDTPNGPIWSRK
ncbi:MAG: cysteine--tRNA ligase [Candidatus Saccharibacteria bacterium]